jgi:RNA polymerase sigma-70 factor (ECF subfamily)
MNESNQDKMNRDQKVRDFVSLLSSQHPRIYTYILTFVPNFNDADDILQEAAKFMWERFDEFTMGTDFLAWAKKITYFLILEYHRNRKKAYASCFDEQLLETLNQNTEKISDSTKEYQVHLKECIKKLKPQDRALLRLRYFENQKVKELALRFGCSVQYVYRNISRIHQLLLSCIQKQLVQRGSL